MKISYRAISETDINLRLKWFADPSVNSYLAGNEPYQTSLEKEKEWFAKYKSEKNKLFFIILADETPVGLVGLMNIEKDRAEIFIVVGEPEYWGKGVGTEALKFIETEAQKRGIQKLHLGVGYKNERAISLYEKSGYSETSKDGEEIVMEKNI